MNLSRIYKKHVNFKINPEKQNKTIKPYTFHLDLDF